MGITGGVGSGKSRVLEILKEEYGFRVIQADQVAKDLMQPGQESYRAVVDFLGPSILNEDGTINRPAMAQVIFGCPDKRVQVDRLTHPLVWNTAFGEALACPEPLVVIEEPHGASQREPRLHTGENGKHYGQSGAGGRIQGVF